MSLTWSPHDNDGEDKDARGREWLRDEAVRQAARRMRIHAAKAAYERTHAYHTRASHPHSLPPLPIARQAVEWLQALAVLVFILYVLHG